jgi:hypothetical protein
MLPAKPIRAGIVPEFPQCAPQRTLPPCRCTFQTDVRRRLPHGTWCPSARRAALASSHRCHPPHCPFWPALCHWRTNLGRSSQNREGLTGARGRHPGRGWRLCLKSVFASQTGGRSRESPKGLGKARAAPARGCPALSPQRTRGRHPWAGTPRQERAVEYSRVPCNFGSCNDASAQDSHRARAPRIAPLSGRLSNTPRTVRPPPPSAPPV